MAGDITLRIDSREMDAAWPQYLKARSANAAKVINFKSLDIVTEALDTTRRASKADILALGGSYVTHGKRGKALKRARFQTDPHGRIRAIIVGKLRRQGKLASVANVSAMAKKELGRRMRSIGYLASGWIPAVRTFLRASKGPRLASSSANARQLGRAKGRAVIARDGRNPHATFENNVSPVGPSGSSLSSRAISFMTTAFQNAINKVARDMAQYLANKEQGIANKFNGRRR